MTKRVWTVAVVLGALAMVGCSAAKSASVDTSETAPEATVATTATTESTTTTSAGPADDTAVSDASATSDDTATTLPPGATPGLDDYDGDGEPDPTCGTQDFGGGLVLRIPCEIRTANDPENVTTLVDKSLYRLPSIDFPEFDDVSASAVQARDADGKHVAIIYFNSDALFAINSADLSGDATTVSLNAAVRVIENHYPGATVQVRGNTDAKGTAPSNQKLSEQRASAVANFFTANGLDPARVSSIGFGSTRPVVWETNADGSDNAAARAFNRRVEIVIRAA
jgi:outer membrane protein OmpA-like peptidoglycan-associated protein